MNVLFISISSFPHASEHSITLDLIHEFIRQGHKVSLVCSLERRENKETSLTEEAGCRVLRVKIGNNKRANIIEKGITTLMMPKLYVRAIKKYFGKEKFDLVLYPTPPVTHFDSVKYVKKRDHAKTYLLLKDIFPQNAVDIGMMSKSGVKGLLYKYFRRKEKSLYAISDRIGCMSPANVEYVIGRNPEVDKVKVEVCPNSIEVFDKSVDADARAEIRAKYGVPMDKKVFVYGGNLGRPQGIPFIIECLKAQKDNDKAFFVIVGAGTEYGKLKSYVEESGQANVMLMQRLPKDDYDKLVAACDVGLIFLDNRFTIPNFPSRLLSYMQAKVPVLACTDANTDVGKVIENGGFGAWCQSNDVNAFSAKVDALCNADLSAMGPKGFEYLKANYSVEDSYKTIMAFAEAQE